MIRVLIVDDEILARVGIQSLLENSRDIQVAGAFSLASTAMDFLKTNIVDIVITDIEMPYMNGLDFIQEIREQHLAEGIIILSSYGNFDYAKRAISLGTDGYILKHNINQEIIENEIYKVYEKIVERGMRIQKKTETEQELKQSGIKAVAVIKLPKSDKSNRIDLTQDNIFFKLVNDIVVHYRMGHLIGSSYDKSPYVIFEFMEDDEIEKRKELQEGFIDALLKNIFQYTNCMPYIAVSKEFCQLQEIPNAYMEAETAAEMRFYKSEKSVFYAEDIHWKDTMPGLMFEKDSFLKQEGISLFERKLRNYLELCKREQIRIKALKEVLLQAISIFVYSIVREYFDENEIVKWNIKYPFIELVTSSESVEELVNGLIAMVTQFKEELIETLNDDEFRDVLDYIEKKCTSGISVQELAELKNISISLLTRKFKLKTGMTPVQYINQRKVELVKDYLKKKEYTLREIADLTGFSNENYMVRMFKKITGKTITDYRKEILKHS